MWFFVLLVILVIIIFQWLKAERIPSGSPIITGARGAGKTRFAVIRIIAKYRSKRVGWKLRNVPLIGWLVAPKYEPHVYSNIPLRLTRKVWADVLKREHILMLEDLPKGATVFIDEIGVMVNQYSHGDPNIISDHYVDHFHCAEIFTRFFRHFIGENEGDFVCTDQAVGDVNIQFRRRFDKALQLQHFRRFLGIFPFYKVYVDILEISEGEIQNTKNVNLVKGEGRRFFFGCLPLPLPWSIRNYATHCYALAYEQKCFVSSVPFDNWGDNPDGLYTNYIIELRSTEAEQAAYHARKKLISKGIAPISESASIAADRAENQASDFAVADAPDSNRDSPESLSRCRWFRHFFASFLRPAGRKERTGE